MAIGTGAAILGAAVIGAGAGLYASSISSSAQSDAAQAAAETTQNATDASVAESQRQYDLSRADLAPWVTAGTNALADLTAAMAAGPGDYEESEGYQYRLDEGNKAIERSAAAKGSSLSGATLKALTEYGQDYATNDYDNFLSRYYNSLTPLQSLAGVGQTSASQTASLGSSTASSIADTTMTGASAVSNALLSEGTAEATGITNAANSITGSANSGINNYLLWKYLPKPQQEEESLFGFDKGWNLE